MKNEYGKTIINEMQRKANGTTDNMAMKTDLWQYEPTTKKQLEETLKKEIKNFQNEAEAMKKDFAEKTNPSEIQAREEINNLYINCLKKLYAKAYDAIKYTKKKT